MKKFLSIIFSAVLCFVLSVGAFAVETANTVDDKLIADIVEGIGDLVDAESEGDSEAFGKAVEGLYADIQSAQESGSMSEVVTLVVNYVINEETDIKDVVSDRGAFDAVIKAFFVEDGYDIEKIKTGLKQSSALKTIVNLYTGANPESPKVEVSEDDQENVNLPEIENPNTGESSASILTAVSVLMVSSAVAAILIMKKD